MMILELSLMVVVSIGEAMIPPVNQSPSSECQPEEVCYPIDPNPPKPGIPSNCQPDGEGGYTCYPIDGSGKF